MAAADEAILKRVLPHSIEAEQSVIGSMIMDREAIVVASEIITGEDFYNRQYGVLFETMVELNDSGRPVDLVTLQDKLREKDVPPEISSLEFIRDLITAVPTSANVKYYAGIVAEKSTLRKLIRLNEEIANTCYAGKEGLEEILETTEKKVFDLVQRRNTGDFVPIRQVVMNAMDRIEKASRNKGNVTGIPTGFIDLDYKTAGLQPSDLILIAARPSMGKTAFVLNIAQNVAFKQGMTVAMFSLEMSKEQFVNRLFSLESKVDSQHLRTGNLTDAEWESLIESAGVIGKSNLIIDDTPGITIAELRSKCRKYLGAALEMPQGEAGVRFKPCHHRLFTADERQRWTVFGFPTAGDFRYFPFLKGTCERTAGSGYRPFPAVPCGRAASGAQTDAVRPA